ncbi:MAG: hypothetical protein QOH16_707 [Gaiellaceae bacterium]|nr:hypothetical protein [Gaiellaceae bacterium]
MLSAVSDVPSPRPRQGGSERAQLVEFPGTETTLPEYCDWLKQQFPAVAGVVRSLRGLPASELEAKVASLAAFDGEFSSAGRGRSWVRGTTNRFHVRRRGMSSLFELMAQSESVSLGALPQDFTVLDAFGGAGFIAQFAQRILEFRGCVVTSDPSALMVESAYLTGLPTLWQRAQDLYMIQEDSLDCVLIAYGAHHVPVPERQQMFCEAWRVLRPGGTLVFHDFVESSPMATFFRDVVHRYSRTGHDHEHFTSDGLATYLARAGLSVTSVHTMADDFQFDGVDAQREATEWIKTVYGLEKLPAGKAGDHLLWREVRRIFEVNDSTAADDESGRLAIRRDALVALARKTQRVRV